MVAHRDVLSKAYNKAALEALRYIIFASSAGVSIPSAIRIKNGEFRIMLEILEQGETKHAHYLGGIVKPLEEAGLLNCDPVSGYCKVTDEGTKVVERFNTATRKLDTILESIDWFGMEILNKKHIILKGEDRLRSYGILVHRPFIPEPERYKNPFIQAFIEAEGEPYDFILKIISFYYPLAFLLTAKYITIRERAYIKYALTCEEGYGYPIRRMETKEILEILRNEDIYPTGEEINDMLRSNMSKYMEYLKEYGILKLIPPLQIFGMYGLIEKPRDNEVFCTCGVAKHYKHYKNIYRLTGGGEDLAAWTGLHILHILK